VRFAGKYIDNLDIDEANKPREKDFIPHSLRSEMPLSCSKIVKQDDRCASSFGMITTLMEKANAQHAQYKTEMSVTARAIAEEELAARINILGCKYGDAILDFAKGLVLGRRRENKDNVKNILNKGYIDRSAGDQRHLPSPAIQTLEESPLYRMGEIRGNGECTS